MGLQQVDLADNIFAPQCAGHGQHGARLEPGDQYGSASVQLSSRVARPRRAFASGCLLWGLICAVAVWGTAVLAHSSCKVEPELEQWMAAALAQNDVVLVGELHGTHESPTAFGRMVCASLGGGSPIIVGLELPERAIDAVRESLRSTDAGGDLSQATYWPYAHDGRTSNAMFDLVVFLLELEAADHVQLLGVDVRRTGQEPFGELVASQISEALSQHPDGKARAILLAGRGHIGFFDDGRSMAHALAANLARTLSIEFLTAGGTAWVCRAGACGESPVSSVCGRADDVPGDIVELDPVRQASRMCLGAVSASRPKVP